VVIVTGAGNGIGRAEALAFAAEGAKVVVNDIGGSRAGQGRDDNVAKKVASEINDAGGEASAAVASVGELDGAESVIWTALSRYGRVDVLVNNAGILRDRSLLNMSEAEYDAVLNVHLKGTWLMTRAFARALKHQRAQESASGRAQAAIVNTTSLSGLRGNFGQSNYSAAKAGIYGLTLTSAMELAKLECRVNAIAPVALTRMTEDIPMLQQMGVSEMGPEHIAPVVTWLASDLASELSGEIVGVHGKKVFFYKMDESAGLDTPPAGDAWTPQALAEHVDEIRGQSAGPGSA
jgi:NAD(P)-dependent dehydrogenase (short-subunit alcohol dehydrogenase family)